MTRRERQVLIAINDAIAQTGVSPSSSELAASLGLSTGVVSQHMRRLVEAGFLRSTRYGRAVRALEVVKLPGGGLTAVEMAWCTANPERVRALMRLAGHETARSRARPAATPPSPRAAEALAEGLLRLELMEPGDEIEIELPRRRAERRRCYLRLSTVASRLWGPGGAVRRSTERGLRLQRIGEAVL